MDYGNIQGKGALNQPMVAMHMDTTAGDMTISHASWPPTVITMSKTIVDTCSGHDDTAYTWTPNVSGIYFVSAKAQFVYNHNENAQFGLYVYKNNDVATVCLQACNRMTAAAESVLVTNGFVDLNGSTDYIQARAYHYGTAGNATLTDGSAQTQMYAYRIGDSTA